MKEGMTNRNGFTIVELLTVMGVIAVLIGLLVPALNLVKDYAKQIQQRAQFHSIDAALEMFSADFGYYPESNDNLDRVDNNQSHPVDQFPYCGANKLAEALVGLDYLGFHPNSGFRSDGLNSVVDNTGATIIERVYRADQGSIVWQDIDENIKARKGPYIEFENANAFRMDEVFAAANLTQGGFTNNFATTTGNFYPLVLCDIFAKKRTGSAAGNSKKTGMPVLYYRARTQFVHQDWDTAVSPTSAGSIFDDIYYYPDNMNLLALGSADDPTGATQHPLADGDDDLRDFEEMILNKQVQGIQRPYRAGSYILISAGKDGLYGTGDDMFNFTKETQ